MDKYDIRKANLQALIDHLYGLGARGAKTKFARRIGRQPDYISRCLYPTGKAGAKNIGEDFASAIEREFMLPRYAMGDRGLRFDQHQTPPWHKAYTQAAPNRRQLVDAIVENVLQMPIEQAQFCLQLVRLIARGTHDSPRGGWP